MAQKTLVIQSSPPSSQLPLTHLAFPTQIGLARLITDRVPFVYLTDVCVLPSYQNLGLGRWMISCVREYLEEWEHMKRVIFINIGEGKWYRECFEGFKGGVRP
jgi:GNAT superfamily N-acetyltransferase